MTSFISEYYADTDETMVGDSVCSRLDEHYKANNITFFQFGIIRFWWNCGWAVQREDGGRPLPRIHPLVKQYERWSCVWR